MAIQKTEGIILSTANWSESSQMLTVFTPDRGKLSLAVKGSRRLNGKRGRPLRFARLEMNVYIRDDAESGYLSDVEPVEVFLFEKDGQLGRLTFASGAIELLNNLLLHQEPQAACYQITLSFLRMNDQLPKNRLPGLFAGYILRLVSLLGFGPNFTGCCGCGKAVAVDGEGDDLRTFSYDRGGMLCPDCRGKSPGQNNMIGLKPAVHGKLVRLMASSLEEASNIKIAIPDLNTLVELLTMLLKFHAGSFRQLKSFDFLDKLARAVKTFGG